MPWTATVQVDTDKDNVGTATAIWNAGGADEFTHSERVKATATDAAVFIAAAIAARDLRDEIATKNTTLGGWLANALNVAEGAG